MALGNGHRDELRESTQSALSKEDVSVSLIRMNAHALKVKKSIYLYLFFLILKIVKLGMCGPNGS